MFKLAEVRKGDRVIDPSCGDGSFLHAAPEGLDLSGCEIDPRYAAKVAKIAPAKRLIQGDALTVLLNEYEKFDLAIGNPPFSAQANLLKEKDLLLAYDLGRGRTSQCLEILFIELFWKLAKPDGKIAIILPDGPLSNVYLKFVRDWLLERTHVEAIISLPRGIFRHTAAKTNIVLARRLPVASQAYLNPTAMFICNDLSELKNLPLQDWLRVEPRWKHVVLASALDWRPEAQVDSANKPTDAVRLGDLFDFRSGFALYGKNRALFDHSAPNRLLLLRSKNVAQEGGLSLEKNLAYIERGSTMYRERAVVKPGDLVFVRVGVGCYGRTALVPAGLEAHADDCLFVLRPVKDIDCEGLVRWMNRTEGRSEVRRLAKGVGALSVSASSLAELRVPSHLLNGHENPAVYDKDNLL